MGQVQPILSLATGPQQLSSHLIMAVLICLLHFLYPIWFALPLRRVILTYVLRWWIISLWREELRYWKVWPFELSKNCREILRARLGFMLLEMAWKGFAASGLEGVFWPVWEVFINCCPYMKFELTFSWITKQEYEEFGKESNLLQKRCP